MRKGDIHIYSGVVLCDAAAIVELRRAGLLEETLDAGLPLAISDLVSARELQPGEHVEGLRIEELSPPILERAFVLHRLHPRLALTDASTLALAAQRSWPLLTQTSTLCHLAVEFGVQLRSLNWLRDELLERQRAPRVAEEKGTFSPGTVPRFRAFFSVQRSGRKEECPLFSALFSVSCVRLRR